MLFEKRICDKRDKLIDYTIQVFYKQKRNEITFRCNLIGVKSLIFEFNETQSKNEIIKWADFKLNQVNIFFFY